MSKGKILATLTMIAIFLMATAVTAVKAQPSPDASAFAPRDFSPNIVGTPVAGDTVTLKGVLTLDKLAPAPIHQDTEPSPTETPGTVTQETLYPYSNGTHVTWAPLGTDLSDEGFYPLESGYPWSEENVSITITRWGEIPSFLVESEHIGSEYPIAGWILELEFFGTTAYTGPEGTPEVQGTKDYWVRYAWALYSTPDGTWTSPLGTHYTDVKGIFRTAPPLFNESSPEMSYGTSGEAGIALIQDAKLRLMVNTTRLAIVKVDLSLLIKTPSGALFGDNEDPITLNFTYVFFKDRKYVIEYKNVNIPYLHKTIADHVKVKLMQIKQIDVDWGKTKSFKTDAHFFPDATLTPLEKDTKYYDKYSLALVQPDQYVVVPGTAHTFFWAFYPAVSGYDVRAWDQVASPLPVDTDGDGNVGEDFKTGASWFDLEDDVDGGFNCVLGAWFFESGAEKSWHLVSIEGVEEKRWDLKDEDGDDGNPGGDIRPGLPVTPEVDAETEYYLDEIFYPKLWDYWLTQEGVTEQQITLNEIATLTGPSGSEAYWSPLRHRVTYVVGNSDAHPPMAGAHTLDTLGAVDIAHAVVGWAWDVGGYQSALDTAAAEYQPSPFMAPTGGLAIHRWFYFLWDVPPDPSDWLWKEYPVKICSIVDYENTDPYKLFTYPKYLWPDKLVNYDVDIDDPDVDDNWQGDIVTVGGPMVNYVTNYFNDFSFAVFAGTWPQPSITTPSIAGAVNVVGSAAIYVPGSKRVYVDYKDEDGAEHYFALVSIVKDMNATAAFMDIDLDGDGVADISAGEIESEHIALIVAGIRAKGTEMAASFVANTWRSWGALEPVLKRIGTGLPADGAVAVVLEFIDLDQDGHVDTVQIVEVVGTVVTDKTVVPDILPWEQVIYVPTG